MIEIGYLTAAYLMWFRALDYSWVLQSHLNTIREQIMNPEKDVLRTRFSAYCRQVNWPPWIGLVTISDEIALAAWLENTFVLFLPMDGPDLYSKLGGDFTGKVTKNIFPLQVRRQACYGRAICLAFNNRMLIAPDAVMDEGLPYSQIQLISESFRAQLPHKRKEEFEQKAKTPKVAVIHTDTTHVNRQGKIIIRK